MKIEAPGSGIVKGVLVFRRLGAQGVGIWRFRGLGFRGLGFRGLGLEGFQDSGCNVYVFGVTLPSLELRCRSIGGFPKEGVPRKDFIMLGSI